MDRSYSSLRQVHEDHRHIRHRRENPSFSSTLLDAIYRSIDGEEEAEDRYGEERELVLYRETMRKKQSSGSGSGSSFSSSNGLKEEEKMASLRRACMIEKWMEKKVSEKVVVRRSSAADFDRKVSHGRDSHVNHGRREVIALMNSSSSSSESSSGGGFSSSESESLHRPKPIRTSVSAAASETSQFGGGYSCHHHSHHHHQQYGHQSAPKQKPNNKHGESNGFVKTKSKALKIYGDLKKVKQPISPGGRLASFLNSLFANASQRKSKSKPKPGTTSSPSTTTTTTACSSASSFSRSCLSNTSTKFSEASSAKRSVRFCPVSVIVDEDCRPCGQKSLLEEDHGERAIMAITAAMRGDPMIVGDDRRRVQEVAIDLLKSYQKKNLNDGVSAVVEEFDMRDVVDVVRMRNDGNESENDNDDEDDAASYSSSDLFELDNLSAIGIERYREELPVYETTHFDTNRAIANGLIL